MRRFHTFTPDQTNALFSRNPFTRAATNYRYTYITQSPESPEGYDTLASRDLIETQDFTQSPEITQTQEFTQAQEITQTQEIPRGQESHDTIRTLESKCEETLELRLDSFNITSNETFGQLRYHKLWQKLLIKMRGAVFLYLLCKELRVYGTSSGVYDQSKNYKRNIENFVKAMKNKELRKYDTDTPSLVLNPEGLFKRIWGILMLILLIYTLLITPYRIAFDDPSLVDSWFWLEISMDFIFIIDIFINSISAYEKPNGTLETSRRKILWKYFKTWFLLDLVGCLPVVVIDLFEANNQDKQHSEFADILRLFRLIRLSRIQRIDGLAKFGTNDMGENWIDRLQDALSINTGVLRIMKFVVTVMLIVHQVGCFWYFLAKLEGFPPDCWVVKTNMMDRPEPSLYIASIYWAFTTLATVGYGDITGGTKVERTFSILWMLVGVGFYSYTIGSLTSVLCTLDTRANELTIKLNAVDLITREARLAPELKLKLRKAIKMHAKKTELDTGDKQLMYNSLPKTLRYQVALNMYEGAAIRIPFFQCRTPEFINLIIPNLQYNFFETAEYVYNYNDDADEIYIISKGRVNFVTGAEDIRFKSMLEGSYFGDVEMLLGLKRICSSKVEYETELLVISKPVMCS